MNLVGGISIKAIPVDTRIKKAITIITTTEVSQKIRNVFMAAFKVIADQLEHEDMLDIPKFNCVIINNNFFCASLDAGKEGNFCRLCIYPIHIWKKEKRSELTMIATIVEELSHGIWSIDDEIKVKYKVLEILKRISPTIKLEHLYKKEWLIENSMI